MVYRKVLPEYLVIQAFFRPNDWAIIKKAEAFKVSLKMRYEDILE